MSFETTNGLKCAPEVIAEGLKIKIFLRGHAPRPPYRVRCHTHSPFAPRYFLQVSFCPPLYIYLNETLIGPVSTLLRLCGHGISLEVSPTQIYIPRLMSFLSITTEL